MQRRDTATEQGRGNAISWVPHQVFVDCRRFAGCPWRLVVASRCKALLDLKQATCCMLLSAFFWDVDVCIPPVRLCSPTASSGARYDGSVGIYG